MNVSKIKYPPCMKGMVTNTQWFSITCGQSSLTMENIGELYLMISDTPPQEKNNCPEKQCALTIPMWFHVHYAQGLDHLNQRIRSFNHANSA